jgi:hypothetical protein
MQPSGGHDASPSQPLARTIFGVVARPQSWLNFVYDWLAFPLGLAYFVLLVTALSVGISLVIVLVGVPILMLTAAAWWFLASFERVLAQRLLGADVPRAPRPWERGDDVWGRLKAHFSAGVTYTDLVYLLLKLPMGVVSFVLCVTGAAIVVAFVGAPFLQLTGTLHVAGQRVDSWALAVALVPVGLLALFGWLHLLNAWAWVSRRLAEALLRGETAEETPEPAGQPVGVPAAVVWQGEAAWPQGQTPAWMQSAPPAAIPYAPPAQAQTAAQAPVTPHLPQPLWVQTPYGWQPTLPPEGWPPPVPPASADDPRST